MLKKVFHLVLIILSIMTMVSCRRSVTIHETPPSASMIEETNDAEPLAEKVTTPAQKEEDYESLKRVEFTFEAPAGSESVTVAGTFNDWNTEVTPLKRIGNSNIWTTAIALPPGRYEYKFVVNGDQWHQDPENTERVSDPYGGYNSLLIVE